MSSIAASGIIPIAILLWLLLAGGFIWVLSLFIRALLKYLRSEPIRKEKETTKVTLGQAIKANRQRCQMTQEFVAEAIGVSRQAVSKWESGTSDPSTSNLIALAKLFGISPGELLQDLA